jgi:hypothetical protein
MKRVKVVLSSGMALALVFAAMTAITVTGATAAPGQRVGFAIPGGTAQLVDVDMGGSLFDQPEMRGGARSGNAIRPYRAFPRDRSVRKPTATPPVPLVPSTPVSLNAQGLQLSFEGLNHFDQRFANGGNQFSLEPPDEGLCVGGSWVMNTVNTVLQVYNAGNGSPASGVVDLNTFYGYPAEFNRTTGLSGPFLTDPNCWYDPVYNRWVHTVLTIDVDPPTGNFLGTNHIDIAVSNTANPLGTWSVYQIPAQDNGTQGTPDHGCIGGFCLGDYPQIGHDANGFYVSVNSYSFFSDDPFAGYMGAQVYAMSRTDLTNGGSLQFVQVENLYSAPGTPAYAVWPAESPPGQFDSSAGGTQYFLSTTGGDGAETGNFRGFSNELVLWKLQNTASLNGPGPFLTMTSSIMQVGTYGLPPKANQKPGNIPLADCLNLDCFGFGPPPVPQTLGVLDQLDTRLFQTWYQGGRLFGATGAIVNVGGEDRSGIEWWIVDPNGNGGAGSVLNQGYLATNDAHISFPSILTLPNGRGLMGMTLSGDNHWPSQAYIRFNSTTGPSGPIRVAAAGVGPQDGFTEYFIGGGRPRWQDYSAAAIDPSGRAIWLGAEYIAQTCTLQQYLADTSCGGTRSALANWSNRVSRIRP